MKLFIFNMNCHTENETLSRIHLLSVIKKHHKISYYFKTFIVYEFRPFFGYYVYFTIQAKILRGDFQEGTLDPNGLINHEWSINQKLKKFQYKTLEVNETPSPQTH